MKGCLRDRRLAAVFAGDEAAGERAHLRACASCAARYAELERHMRLAVGALLEGPPDGRPARVRGAAWRWVPAVAALGLALALVLTLAPSGEAPVPPDLHADLRAATTELSAALFGIGDGSAAALSARVPAGQFASAALEGGWPCHDRDGLGSDCAGF